MEIVLMEIEQKSVADPSFKLRISFGYKWQFEGICVTIVSRIEYSKNNKRG